jgi:hypothetical protein
MRILVINCTRLNLIQVKPNDQYLIESCEDGLRFKTEEFKWV